MKELNNLRADGVDNKAFSERYEEFADVPNDEDDGPFMFENRQLSSREYDREYMNEVRTFTTLEFSVSCNLKYQRLFIRFPFTTYANP